MKKVFLAILISSALLLSACASPEPKVIPYPGPGSPPPPSGYTYDLPLGPVSIPEPMPTPTPSPVPEPIPEPIPPPELAPVPTPSPESSYLDYEVVKSSIDTDTFNERRTLVIGDTVIQDEVVEVSYPIGCITLKNTDTVRGTFKIIFYFYAVDKFTAETHKKVFGDVDVAFIKMAGQRYMWSDILSLDPGATGTAKYKMPEINMDEDEWLWEFGVIPSTKLK